MLCSLRSFHMMKCRLATDSCNLKCLTVSSAEKEELSLAIGRLGESLLLSRAHWLWSGWPRSRSCDIIGGSSSCFCSHTTQIMSLTPSFSVFGLSLHSMGERQYNFGYNAVKTSPVSPFCLKLLISGRTLI